MNKFTSLFALVVITFFCVELSAQGIYKTGWTDYNKNGKKDVYEDPSAPINARVDDLLKQMNLDEKLAQLRSGINRDGIDIDPTQKPIGVIEHTSENKGPADGAKVTNSIQKKQIEKSRLGIPLIFIEEALHGLKTPESTHYPQAMGLAATWNPELLSQISKAIADECRIRGVRQVLSPVIDLGRDPRWGRTQETYGEDPYLVSRMGVAFCKPLEQNGVITTIKHFVANSGDGGRDSWAQFYSERYLNEVYFPPYIACIKEAGSRSIMPSYGSLNGIPTVASNWLLNEKARKDWGFTGYFGSDFGAVEKVFSRHRTTADSAEVAALCLNSGNDVEWPNAIFYDKPMKDAIAKGLISEKTLDDAVKRMLRIKFAIGLFEEPFCKEEDAAKVTNSPEHRALALETARQSMTLLKNENNTLPLNPKKIKNILVVGQKGEEQDLGGYSSSGMKKVSIVEGFKNQLPNTEVTYMAGPQTSMSNYIYVPGKIFNNGRGFKAEYFNGSDFNAKPILVKNEETIQKGWWGVIKVDGLKQNDFSIRWSGSFTPQNDISATLAILAVGKLSVLINGKEILNSDGSLGKPEGFYSKAGLELPFADDFGKTKFSTKYNFVKGQNYDISVTWSCKDAKEMFAHLFWDQRITLNDEINSAVELAKKSDAVIVVPSGLGEGEFRDRPILDLPQEEEKLINELGKIGKPVIVVMVNGAAVTMMNWIDSVPAVLESWYSGEEGGNAIAETILGKNNPGGKMPYTSPQFTAQCPLNYNYFPIGRSKGFQDPWNGRPLFPFGHGLSYTIFDYSNVALSNSKVKVGESVVVSFDVKNNGSVKGDEVAQLYIWDEVASVVRPLRELKGFKRISLNPNESKKVELSLTPSELSIWDKDMNYVMEPGWITLYVGSSSEDIRLKTRFEITK